MATFQRDASTSIYYEEHGSGFPILLFAPGGMRSAASFWRSSEWDPIETLSPHFRVVAMDQRNAGASRAPVSGTDGWATYTADHVALLDHLGIEQAHVMGGCIGGPYCMGMIDALGDRITAAILQQSIGAEDNQQLFYEMFDSWADPIKADHPEAKDADWEQFRSNMFGGDFLYNVDRDFVRSLSTPLLVLMGSDAYHPERVSREIAELAPNATFVEQWKSPERDGTVGIAVEFLQAHTPD